MIKRARKISGKYKSLSDQELKLILEKEYKEHPENFVSQVSEPLPKDSQEILRATSGKLIEPSLKWF